MEAFLSLFVFHDIYVVSSLVVGITIVVVMLLLFNQKSPESIVKTEVGGSEQIEGALRRVLGEQRWEAASGASSVVDSDDRVGELEKEVLQKDQTIADLNKQLTQSSGGSTGISSVEDNELMSRVAELEARLQEYEIIEDDIADLSLYKNENSKLKEELDRLKGMTGDGQGSAPSKAQALPEEENKNEDREAPAISNVVVLNGDNSDSEAGDAADLVAEFEKVVNNQAQITPENSSLKQSIEAEKDTGKVMMVDQVKEKSSAEDVPRHEKLKGISPDSKEEADVFITELKSLKKGTS